MCYIERQYLFLLSKLSQVEKLFIKNRNNHNIAIIIEKSENQKGLVFIMHALGATKEQLQIQTFAEAFKDNNYTVIRFDTTNSCGESEGNYEDATVTNYYEDLEDIISWAKKQIFYEEPFILCGHSLGWMCSVLYAEKTPNEIKALAPISTLISGKLSKMRYSEEELSERERTGRQIRPRSNGGTKKLKWSHFIDRMNYDILPNIKNITMPVLMIVGDLDRSAPIIHQQILFDQLPNKKEFHIIHGAAHDFKEHQHLKEVYHIFDKRIKKL